VARIRSGSVSRGNCDNHADGPHRGPGVGRCRLHPPSVRGLWLQRAIAMLRSSRNLCQEQHAWRDSLARPGPGPPPWPGASAASFGRRLLRVSSGIAGNSNSPESMRRCERRGVKQSTTNANETRLRRACGSTACCPASASGSSNGKAPICPSALATKRFPCKAATAPSVSPSFSNHWNI
jgi:hypothetical protein